MGILGAAMWQIVAPHRRVHAVLVQDRLLHNTVYWQKNAASVTLERLGL